MEKVVCDPVHDFVVIRGPLALALVDTPEFQRLRRIRQLGLAAGTYPGAEHTRFGHSLGTMHVLELIRARLAGHPDAAAADWEAMTPAALLHDVGHGPLSHLWERLTGVPHETWTRAVIAGETMVNRILRRAAPDLPERVLHLLAPRGKAFLGDILSGQLDVDRMDYLLRDAVFTGAGYGRFDLERLVHSLAPAGGRLAVRHRGLASVEEYLLARYFMYRRVYFHKTVRAAEATLALTWRRARHLFDAGNPPDTPPSLRPFLAGEEVTLGVFLEVDDGDLLAALKSWRTAADPVLRELAGRVLERRYLKPVLPEPVTELSAEALEAAASVLAGGGYTPAWHLAVDSPSLAPYDVYDPAPGREEPATPILILGPDGALREVSDVSPLVDRLARLPRPALQVYVPEEARPSLVAALGPFLGRAPAPTAPAAPSAP